MNNTPKDSVTNSSGTVFGDTSTAEGIVSSAKSVRDDFHFGDDLAITNPPNWNAQESTELYNGAINNNDPGTADAMGQAWHNQGKDLVEASNALYEAITELGGAWIGQAAGAAQGALIGVANASSTAGDAALAMGKRMSEQAAAAAEIKKMPPPQEFDKAARLTAILSGNPAALAADIKAQHDAAEAVKAEQRRYMEAYTKAMTDIDRTTPDFGPESIGMKPVTGSRYGSSGVGGISGMGVSDGGPGLSQVQSKVDGAATGMGVGSGQPHAGTIGTGGVGGAGGVAAAHPGTTPLGHATTTGPLSTSATGQVSTAPTGPGVGAALGAGALGAGLGVAGMKAYGKGKAGDKKQQPTQEELAAAAQAAEADQAQDTPDAQEQPARQQPSAQPQVPHVGEATGGRHAAPEPQAPSAPQVPHVGSGAGHQPGQYTPAPAAVQAPYVGEPSAAVPPAAESAPLEQGKVFAAGDATAGEVTAAGDVNAANSQAGAGAQQAAQPLAQQQAWANQAAAAGMAPPVTPMGGGAGMAGGGAGMGGAVGGGESDHAAASYLIQPDPDDMFGVGEAVTSGVIGAEDEDD